MSDAVEVFPADEPTIDRRAIAPDMGDGVILFGGWCEPDELESRGFRVIIEFPSGPPDIAMDAVWGQKPVRIVMKPNKGE